LAQTFEGGIDIGTCAVDIEKGHRQYEQRYALNDKEGVTMLLKDLHRLRERRFHAGDFSASDLLLDIQTAIDNAKLSNRQRLALYWIYEMDLTQKDAAVQMGVTREAVTQLIGGAVERIAGVFSKWEYGEITVLYEDETSRSGGIR
jgi:DNA-directed RNA polymerase specialized sigma subunit